jgi:hypothetical protein
MGTSVVRMNLAFPHTLAMVALAIEIVVAISVLVRLDGINPLSFLILLTLALLAAWFVSLLLERIELRVDDTGLRYVRRGVEVHFPWSGVAAVGVTTFNRVPWIVLWPDLDAPRPQQNFMRRAWSDHLGGYLLGRLNRWELEPDALCDVLRSHAGDKWNDEPTATPQEPAG